MKKLGLLIGGIVVSLLLVGGFWIYRNEYLKDLVIEEPLTLEFSKGNLKDNEFLIREAINKLSEDINTKKELVVKELEYDTSELAESKEGKILLEDGRDVIFKYEVIDSIPPVIEGQFKYETEAGIAVDFDLKAVDNHDGEIEVELEGDFDFRNPGEYALIAVAVDQSGNKSMENISLKVNEIVVKENEMNRNENKENQIKPSNVAPSKPNVSDTESKPDYNLFEEDGDFVDTNGIMNYLYKVYDSFEACHVASNLELENHSDWVSTSCLDKALYYTK